ncbi:hypothetical protein LCGC14_2093270 [marine sediment metagenome]|uniref:Uncharacterized protein n=1 Tax=marine sediment metagenome TaxID=412755 RepID=A0A0F9ECB3_9ZZZZ
MAFSEGYADAPWWEKIYRQAFPSMASMTYVKQDGWAQRGGIDRVITLRSGKGLWIDEKVRSEDRPDILLEYRSNDRTGALGWVAKDLATDYIAYAFIPSQRCYLLPFATLRRAWKEHAAEWIKLGELGRSSHWREGEGFYECRARNEGYWTISVAVPIPQLMAALTDAMVINWGPL